MAPQLLRVTQNMAHPPLAADIRPRPGSVRARSGFTIIELMAVVMIIGILAGFGVPKLREAVERAKVARAIGEINAIQWDLMALEQQNQPLPADLSGVGRGGMKDPWGFPYQYYKFPTRAHGNPPGARRDRFLVPINSTFDLYSVGPDGQTSPPLTASMSQDDIVRANDGGFIGKARDF